MRIFLVLAGLLGPALTLLLPPPAGLTPAGWATAGLAVMMALWWMTGALPLAVTALLPLALGPLLASGSITAIAGAYVHPLLFPFLCGFLIGRRIERWGLHRRIALWTLGLARDRPARLVGGVMLATAFLSLWISHTAAAIVMLPISASLAGTRPNGDRFATATMLGVAYAATIGGMGWLIGTPPNALFEAYVSQSYGGAIGFAQWAAVGLPVAGMIDGSGLAGWIGVLVGRAEALPVGLLILALAATIVYLGELASNTAMAAVFLPVAGAAAPAAGVEPVSFLLPIALAASVGFMLPVATPPNAIVMKSPAVTRAAMLRAGAPLDVIGVLLAVGISRLLGGVLL